MPASRHSRDLQAAVAHPYLVTGFDDFIFMSAPRYYRGADTENQSTADEFTNQGVQMRRTSGLDDAPSVVADFGPVFRRILAAMAPAVRTLVDTGAHNLAECVRLIQDALARREQNSHRR